jgi:hypothetical protein
MEQADETCLLAVLVEINFGDKARFARRISHGVFPIQAWVIKWQAT